MSLHKKTSQQTLLKAFQWLNQQPGNWSEHIKDSQIAIKLYLKAQNKKKQSSKPFQEKLKPYLKPDIQQSLPLTRLNTNSSKKQNLDTNSLLKEEITPPPADLSELLPKKKEQVALSENKGFFLDKNSQKTLEQTKKDLNLEKEEEALRLLIQLGQKALLKVFK